MGTEKFNRACMSWSFCNTLSLARIPLAFLFLSSSPVYRTTAILLAMLTDVLDGYIARRFKKVSPMGALLDPLADKFFVFFAMMIFFFEQRFALWQCLALLSRDFALFLFGSYLILVGQWPYFRFRSILSGKISTILQLVILLCTTYRVNVPSYVFIYLIILGAFALCELSFLFLWKKERSGLAHHDD